MSEEEGVSLELDLKERKGRISGKKTAEIISILCALALMAVGGGLWVHARDSENQGTSIHLTMRELLRSQREATCLLGFPEHQREAKANWCRELSR